MMRASIKGPLKTILCHGLPLALRKRLAILLNRMHRLDADTRYWWTRELLRDFAGAEPSAYHRFLWSHHLAYAVSYEVDQRFGAENQVASRKIFFDDLLGRLRAMGVDPQTQIRSVFEVGCSLGYQLHLCESTLFPSAEKLVGIDIDRPAIERGSQYLRSIGSRVRLYCEDMGNLEAFLAGSGFDVVLCNGVLMYLQAAEARQVVRTMLAHTRVLLGLSDPGCPQIDNGRLAGARLREMDGSFFHNLDAMVAACGGEIVGRRWEGNRVLEGQRLYFVFARRPAGDL